MGHTGIARSIRPSHTPSDGDTVFALATGTHVEEPADLVAAGALAARALERAVLNAVRHATTLAGVPAAGTPPVVRPVADGDRPWIDALVTREFGANTVISCGRRHRP